MGQLGLEKGFMPRFQNDKASLTDMMHGNPNLRAPNYSILNPSRPNNDVSQTSHCNIKGVSVSEVIENMITQVQFY